MEGWIKLHRQVLDSPLWQCERFTRGQAWVDLLLSVNHAEKRIYFNSDLITIQRGQLLTSMVKLAEKWQWNRKTVSSFLKLLEKDSMITIATDNRKTLITIVNYTFYQSKSEVDGHLITHQNRQQNGQQSGQPRDSRADTNKNEKNEKNEKKVKREVFTPPTAEDVRVYCGEHGYSVDAERFVDFYTSKGWMVGKNKMKDWRCTVRNWSRQGKEQKKPVQRKNSFADYPHREYDYEAIKQNQFNQ